MLSKSMSSTNFQHDNKKIAIFSFAIFLISPLFSLPFILLSIYNKERFALFVLSLFFGILSYYLIPSWDLDISRYYFIYEEIAKGDFDEFKRIVSKQNDYFFYFIYFLFSRFSISFQTYTLIMSIFCFYSCFRVGDFIIRRFNPNRLSYFILMLSFVLSLPVLHLISVTRFSIAFVFFMLYVYHHLEKNNKISFCFLLLSCFTHFAFLVYIPFLFLFSFFKNRTKINLLLIFVGFFSFILSVGGGLSHFLNFIPLLAEKANIYLGLYQEVNIFILSFMLLTPVFISVVFYLRFNKHLPYYMLQVFSGVFIVVLICLPTNMIIYDRYIQVFKPIFALTIITSFYNEKDLNYRGRGFLRVLLLLSCLVYLMYYFYTFYIIYKDSFRGFISISKLLLFSILDSTYSYKDFFR